MKPESYTLVRPWELFSSTNKGKESPRRNQEGRLCRYTSTSSSVVSFCLLTFYYRSHTPIRFYYRIPERHTMQQWFASSTSAYLLHNLCRFSPSIFLAFSNKISLPILSHILSKCITFFFFICNFFLRVRTNNNKFDFVYIIQHKQAASTTLIPEPFVLSMIIRTVFLSVLMWSATLLTFYPREFPRRQ